MKTITVKIKNVYGEKKVYPVSDEAILFACIAGTTTLTNSTINRIKQLGYSIWVEQQTLQDRIMTTIDKLSKDAVMPIGEANTLVTYFNNTDDWHYKVIHVGEEDAKILITDSDGYKLGYMQG